MLKDDKRKLIIGPILAVFGMGLYNLLKGHNAIYIVFIGLIMSFIYELYKLNKYGKANLEVNILLIIAIILMIIGILHQAFYDSFIKYHFNALTIPIIIFTLLTMMFVVVVVGRWKSGDKAKAKKLIIVSIVGVTPMVLLIVLAIVRS
jgi:CDP-diglyceride synthetase